MTDDRCTPAIDHLLLPLLASPASAGLARTLAEQRLRRWGDLDILDDALLVVAELVSNAAKETPGEEIRLELVRDARDAIVAVWDSSPRLPRPRPPAELRLEDLDLSADSFDDDGGRGLLIVASLTSRNGCTRDPRGGKWVWAAFSGRR
ncbi:ATP-binding protein [Actinocorallia populi]|uniref:ATP-binding protein n=1 Tax=Actinocorallia populi TaxID=2079200 RepID=UPI000D08A014|nr:ATP-binding protein [Actinocorallia populi]